MTLPEVECSICLSAEDLFATEQFCMQSMRHTGEFCSVVGSQWYSFGLTSRPRVSMSMCIQQKSRFDFSIHRDFIEWYSAPLRTKFLTSNLKAPLRPPVDPLRSFGPLAPATTVPPSFKSFAESTSRLFFEKVFQSLDPLM